MNPRKNAPKLTRWLATVLIGAGLGFTFVRAAAQTNLANSTPARSAPVILHIDDNRGNDTNPGTSDRPLKTLEQAARIANAKTYPGSLTFKVAAGIYTLSRSVVFENHRSFSKDERLTIESDLLPDDPTWTPATMPVFLSTEDPRPLVQPAKQTETVGIRIQTSHATLRGLKFLGNPLPNNRHCPVECVCPDLNDVEVTQCLFAGAPATLDIYIGVLTDGNNVVLDHCVFTSCRVGALFWDRAGGTQEKGNAMRYCIVDGATFGGIWTCDTDEAFEFHHNLVARSEYVWLHNRAAPKTYRIRDCVITGNEHFSGYGGETGPTGPTGSDIRFTEERVVRAQAVALGQNPISSDYLHVVPETPWYELRAGLFLEGAPKRGTQSPVAFRSGGRFARGTYEPQRVGRITNESGTAVEPFFRASTLRDPAAATRATLATLQEAAARHQVDMGQYPATFDDLVKPSGPGNWRGPYVTNMIWPPVDGWGHPLRLAIPTRQLAATFRLISAGPDKRFGTPDDVDSEDAKQKMP
jgi:hypothetical protein